MSNSAQKFISGGNDQIKRNIKVKPELKKSKINSKYATDNISNVTKYSCSNYLTNSFPGYISYR